MSQKNFILKIGMFLFVVCCVLLGPISISRSDESQSQQLLSLTSSYDYTDPIYTFEYIDESDSAVDSKGLWHIVYNGGTVIVSGETGNSVISYINNIEYMNSTMSDPVSIATYNGVGSDEPTYYNFSAPSIAIDSHDKVHVMYEQYNCYPTPPQSTELTDVYKIMYINNISGTWSSPQEILSFASSYDIAAPTYTGEAIGEPRIAVDADGNWHMVFHGGTDTMGEVAPHSNLSSLVSYTHTIKYMNSMMSDPVIVANYTGAGSDNPNINFSSPSIAVDSHDKVHIMYGEYGIPYSSSPQCTEVDRIMYINNISGSWSSPQEILSLTSVYNRTDPIYTCEYLWFSDITVDASGAWHMVYNRETDKFLSTGGYAISSVQNINYMSSAMANPINIATHVDEISDDNTFHNFLSSSISTDFQNNIHIIYGESENSILFSRSTDTYNIMHAQLANQLSLEILDGVDFTNGSEVSNNPQKLATGGVAMQGAVTDGVTRLLLRLPVDTPGSATFSLQGTGNPAEDGVLRSVDGFEEGNSITVTTYEVNGKNYAFAIYRAPDSFVRAVYQASDENVAERDLPINVIVDSNPAITQNIKLVRPPLILIHGFWSSPSMWANNDFRVKLGTAIPGLRMFAINYSQTNSDSFLTNSSVPYSCKGDNIQTVRESFNANKIAICQVDILGHSMGGLLARIWAEANGSFRDDNFRMGDIHKLITIDSPHYGAFLADLCMAAPAIAKDSIVALCKSIGKPIDGGAIQDLMTTSTAINNINKVPTTSASHAIIGDFIVPWDGDPDDITWGLPLGYDILYSALSSFSDIKSYIIDSHSDLVVSVANQGGGLNSDALTTLSHYHTNATTDDVLNNTIGLLNASSTSSSFSKGFPKS